MKNNALERLKKLNEKKEARKEKLRLKREKERIEEQKVMKSILNEQKRFLTNLFSQYVDFKNILTDKELTEVKNKLDKAFGSAKYEAQNFNFNEEENEEINNQNFGE